MEHHNREYFLFSACGLNCGLCPHYYTSGVSKCPGCGGQEWWARGMSCGLLSCTQRRGLDYCFECGEYPCARFAHATTFDAFITHKNQLDDLSRAKAEGIVSYREVQQAKMGILQSLLADYDDGRRKSLFCTAVNLLPLPDLQEVTRRIASEAASAVSVAERARVAARLLEELAQAQGVSLRLRKKPKA